MNSNAFFYHIYPLGMCGAPARNDFSSSPGNGLRALKDRIPHLRYLGVNAVYIGPLFESAAHGYDTVDYHHVDRRLGTDEDLKELVSAFHEEGIAVVLDAVLNHTGRHFFAFRDIQEKGPASPYASWYRGVDFSRASPAGDAFMYEGWSGHYDLAKLDTENPAVREHLFSAVRRWIEEFGIDGLRLDAADVLSPDFMDALSAFAKSLKSDFWLMGEVVHGDYRNWARAGRLDSVTNYELYKGLWSSFNDRNFFEIAWSLNRQSGPEGMYRDIELYTFVENHDVNRVASVLKTEGHLWPLYGLLFAVPGVPSLYYGGEWGLRGEKKNGSDAELRPPVRETAEHGRHCGVPSACASRIDAGALELAIKRFAQVRAETQALREGRYRQLHVSSEQFAFIREPREGARYGAAVVVVNSSESEARVPVVTGLGERADGTWKDALDQGAAFAAHEGTLHATVPARSIRILTRQ
jgi:glycosidase